MISHRDTENTEKIEIPRFFLSVVSVSRWLILFSSLAVAQEPAQFHHFHLNIVEPAGAMDYFSRNHGAVKVILQGFGVGVRTGNYYVLFERTDDDPPPLTGDCRDANRCFEDARSRLEMFAPDGSAMSRLQVFMNDPAAAAAWFTQHLGVQGPIQFVARPGAPPASTAIDHVAFSYPNLEVALERLQKEGVRIIQRLPKSVIVNGPEGFRVEIVEDSEVGANAFWCPMDPKVRTSKPGKCPICGMVLVPLDPGEYVEYPVDMKTAPNPVVAGRPAKFTFRVDEPHRDMPVVVFETVHEKLFHLFVVSHDMTFFEHIHPALQKNGTFTVTTTLPKAGPYQVFTDFFPSGGTPQVVQKALVTAGYSGSLAAAKAQLTPDPSPVKTTGSTRLRLASSGFVSGFKQQLTITLDDTKTGGPVKDLEMYLGAWAHMLVLSEDLGDYVHGHATMEQNESGSTQLLLEVTFPRAGNYRLWLQFQRAGKVITVPFTVAISKLR